MKESDRSQREKWRQVSILAFALLLIAGHSSANAGTRVFELTESSLGIVEDLEGRINSTACRAVGLQFVYSKLGYKEFYNVVELRLSDGALEAEVHGNVDQAIEEYIYRYIELSFSGFSEEFLNTYFGLCSISERPKNLYSDLKNIGILRDVTLSDGSTFRILVDKEFCWILGANNEFKFAIPSEVLLPDKSGVKFLDYIFSDKSDSSTDFSIRFLQFVKEHYREESTRKLIIEKFGASFKYPINFGYDVIKGDPFSRIQEE